MPDQQVTTSIDDMLKYVNSHGETDTITLAGALNVDEKIVEDWAGILEKANVVRISYRVGKIYIAPVSLSKEALSKERHVLEAKKSKLETSISEQMVALQQISERIESLKNYAVGGEKAFREKAGGVQSMLGKVDKIEQQANKSYAALKRDKDFIDKMSDVLDKEITAIIERAKQAEGMDLGMENSKKIIADVHTKISTTEAATHELMQKFDKLVEEYRRGMLTLIDSMKGEISALKSDVYNQERQLAGFEHETRKHKNEMDGITRKLQKDRQRMIDEATGAKNEIDKLHDTAQGTMDELRKTLGELKQTFGGYIDLFNDLKSISTFAEAASKEREDISKELAKLQSELKSIDIYSTEQAPASRTEKAEDVSRRSNKAGARITKLGRKVADSEKRKEKTSKKK